MPVLDCLAWWCEGKRPKFIGLPLHAHFYNGASGSAVSRCCHWIVPLRVIWLSSGLCKPEAATVCMGRQEMQYATWPFSITRGYQEYMFSLTKTEGKASHSRAYPLSWHSKVRQDGGNEWGDVGWIRCTDTHYKSGSCQDCKLGGPQTNPAKKFNIMHLQFNVLAIAC